MENIQIFQGRCVWELLGEVIETLFDAKSIKHQMLAHNTQCPIRSNFNRRGVNTREAFQRFGHNFFGCGSYDLGIRLDCSPMSPLRSYTYQRPKFKQ